MRGRIFPLDIEPDARHATAFQRICFDGLVQPSVNAAPPPAGLDVQLWIHQMTPFRQSLHSYVMTSPPPILLSGPPGDVATR